MLGVPCPRSGSVVNARPLPLNVTVQSPGAAANVAEKFTVANVPPVKDPVTICTSPLVFVQVYPLLQAAELTFDPTVNVVVPVGAVGRVNGLPLKHN